MTEELLILAERCKKASDAYDRVMALPEDKAVSVEAMSIAAGMVLSIHGGLFSECAAALHTRPSTPEAVLREALEAFVAKASENGRALVCWSGLQPEIDKARAALAQTEGEG